mmetsp:Transcript_77607/g.199829  ORF Transcript_77607/g.199829 Transcript_77607/m.199829 type:complete len:229 (+) Transcript_77607:927-1613(+)
MLLEVLRSIVGGVGHGSVGHLDVEDASGVVEVRRRHEGGAAYADRDLQAQGPRGGGLDRHDGGLKLGLGAAEGKRLYEASAHEDTLQRRPLILAATGSVLRSCVGGRGIPKAAGGVVVDRGAAGVERRAREVGRHLQRHGVLRRGIVADRGEQRARHDKGLGPVRALDGPLRFLEARVLGHDLVLRLLRGGHVAVRAIEIVGAEVDVAHHVLPSHGRFLRQALRFCLS